MLNNVTKIIVHQNFSVDVPDYDIAILHIKDKVIESPTVKIIEIAQIRPKPGTKALLTGWGKRAYLSPNASIMLMSAQMTIIRLSRCNEISINPPISERFICARSIDAKAAACGVSDRVINLNVLDINIRT